MRLSFPKVGYRLETRQQETNQPNQLDVALALTLQTPARFHPIEVPVAIFNNVAG
jgi:hypothetical protein